MFGVNPFYYPPLHAYMLQRHLSNRERKEVAKRERKDRRHEERKREKKPSADVCDPIGSLAI